MLRGDRICLGPLVGSDSAKLFAWLNDPAVARSNGPYRPLDQAKFDQWFANVGADPARVVFAIRMLGDLRLLGYLQIVDINATLRTANLGLVIGSDADRGKGYGGEALSLAIGCGWRDLNLQRLQLTVVGANPRAIGVYERAGFEIEGVLRRAAYVGGEYRDITVMGLLRTADEAAA